MKSSIATGRFRLDFGRRFGKLPAGLSLLLVQLIDSPCNAQPSALAHKVAMRDGVKLAMDVYLPAMGEPPFPAILIRTPYDKNGSRTIAANVTRIGYALVAQDMRGRYASEGHHAIIFGNEGIGGNNKDGHDTIEWIAKQKWSNGKVVTYGGSALGIAQNMAAPCAPAALEGQVVIVAFSDYYHQAAYQGGV